MYNFQVSVVLFISPRKKKTTEKTPIQRCFFQFTPYNVLRIEQYIYLRSIAVKSIKLGINREQGKIIGFPCPLVRAAEFGLSKSGPGSARLFSTSRFNLALTDGIPPTFRDGVYLLYRHRVSPEFSGSPSCLPMTFTAGTYSMPTSYQ